MVVDRLRKIVKVIYLSEKIIHQPLRYYEETYTFARKLQVSWFEMNLDGQARKVRSYEGGRRPPEKNTKVKLNSITKKTAINRPALSSVLYFDTKIQNEFFFLLEIRSWRGKKGVTKVAVGRLRKCFQLKCFRPAGVIKWILFCLSRKNEGGRRPPEKRK